MRKIGVVLVGCLVLAGCGASEWRQQVRYEVTKIFERPFPGNPENANVRLELVGDPPDDVLEPLTLTPAVVGYRTLRGDYEVGDRFLCWAEQKSEGHARTMTIRTDVSSCEKA
ncbi:hypothetical protein SAMN04488564_104835 [Lentzea waywayandensis]|uniref:Lipoprotein n=1 Tax=Lentzea waywayandensis TaxID=84724 RepID=A0A1I6EL68_9PSEU|nr:hypothetical protein [Lentzea waywayandensis]SFR18516.1 hypothetical protein SAMN04488564_104835 [Lentzea waywayandensis]